MPSHYAAVLPNPFMPATPAKPSRSSAARLERARAKLEGLLSAPKPSPFDAQACHDLMTGKSAKPRKAPAKPRKGSKAR